MADSKPPELQRLERLAAALSKLDRNSDTWRALKEIIVDEFGADAREAAHHPKTPDAERAYWNGADATACEIWKELEDLQSGAWKQWPNAARMRQQVGEEDEE